MKRSVLVLCVSAVLYLGGNVSLTVSEAQMDSRHYIVQYGDTLWDIASDRLNNPHQWRALHQNNPQIVNPNLIYPGDILGLGTAGQAPGTGTRRSDKALARPWYGLPVPAPEELVSRNIPNPLVPSSDFIEAAGFIAPYSLEQLQSSDFGLITNSKGDTTHVVLSEYGQIGLVFGDMIYINKGTADTVREGDVFVAFRPRQEVFHPITSEIMGTQIDILGHLRVRNLEPDIAAAEIIKSYNYIQIGDPIMPISELSVPLEKPALGNSISYGLKVGNQLIGHIIHERIRRPGVSFGDVVYLDVGAAQGVQPADNFIVYREIGEGFPRQAIGRLAVLSVQEQTATALITESVKTINIGEKVVLKR
ncbi:MAG: LysM peptidoglycan-binding domain-containing protein [bacterium]|nr:LysM peptidoglycan-binding domain-containing protein [bacterium]